jgi:thiol-disulfide isomerase/thioredoxin
MRLVRSLLFAALVLSALRARAHDWNDGKIRWVPMDKAAAAATKEKKPILLVVFTEWCPHCRTYAGVFHDPRVVEKSKSFVMVKVDKDQDPATSRAYAPDGEYIPRTYFLDAKGTLRPEIHAPRQRFLYFYDENKADGLLDGMAAALKKKA